MFYASCLPAPGDFRTLQYAVKDLHGGTAHARLIALAMVGAVEAADRLPPRRSPLHSSSNWGQGRSIVFVHGWPLCNEMFEYQFTQLTQGGFRCVAPSLRGFGKSSQPWEGYDLDILADDLRAILEAWCLQDVVLVGFGMGGAMMLRYMTRHAGYRVSKLAFLAAAAPVWTRRGDFPEGGPEQSEVERLVAHCWADRARLVADTIGKFFRTDSTSGRPLADWLFQLGMQASPHATRSFAAHAGPSRPSR